MTHRMVEIQKHVLSSMEFQTVPHRPCPRIILLLMRASDTALGLLARNDFRLDCAL